jgi:tetrahydromethanopterin S-methyltransferase subunit G
MIDSRKLVITPSDYENMFKSILINEIEEKLNGLSGQQFRRLKRKLARK